MDYKSLISDCQLRSEEFRMMHNAEGVVHELQCSKAISGLLEHAEAEENRIKMLESANRILSERITETEAKCKRLDESRERANESAYMWESRCKMLEERAEKAERERDAAISDLTFAVNQYRLFTTDIDLCGLCKFDLPAAGESGQTAECPGYYKDNCFEWRGAKEE